LLLRAEGGGVWGAAAALSLGTADNRFALAIVLLVGVTAALAADAVHPRINPWRNAAAAMLAATLLAPAPFGGPLWLVAALGAVMLATPSRSRPHAANDNVPTSPRRSAQTAHPVAAIPALRLIG
jgi:hypothetical protein